MKKYIAVVGFAIVAVAFISLVLGADNASSRKINPQTKPLPDR